jgi:nicotine blue oxidoreductase
MGRPKARIRWKGECFVQHVVALARGVGAAPCVVVQGAVSLADLPLSEARLVDHPGWAQGPLSSLQAGLAAVEGADGVLVLTVDRPHVRSQTVRDLVDRWREAPQRLWQPQYLTGHGHPLVYPADLVSRLLALPPAASAREVVRAPDVAARRAFMVVDDPAVVDNLDDPEALARFFAGRPAGEDC